jgi:hypothetical protein
MIRSDQLFFLYGAREDPHAAGEREEGRHHQHHQQSSSGRISYSFYKVKEGPQPAGEREEGRHHQHKRQSWSGWISYSFYMVQEKILMQLENEKKVTIININVNQMVREDPHAAGEREEGRHHQHQRQSWSGRISYSFYMVKEGPQPAGKQEEGLHHQHQHQHQSSSGPLQSTKLEKYFLVE